MLFLCVVPKKQIVLLINFFSVWQIKQNFGMSDANVFGETKDELQELLFSQRKLCSFKRVQSAFERSGRLEIPDEIPEANDKSWDGVGITIVLGLRGRESAMTKLVDSSLGPWTTLPIGMKLKRHPWGRCAHMGELTRDKAEQKRLVEEAYFGGCDMLFTAWAIQHGNPIVRHVRYLFVGRDLGFDVRMWFPTCTDEVLAAARAQIANLGPSQFLLFDRITGQVSKWTPLD